MSELNPCPWVLGHDKLGWYIGFGDSEQWAVLPQRYSFDDAVAELKMLVEDGCQDINTRPDLKAELVEAIRKTKGIVLDDNGRSELDDIAGLPTEFIRVEDAIRAINTIMGDTE